MIIYDHTLVLRYIRISLFIIFMNFLSITFALVSDANTNHLNMSGFCFVLFFCFFLALVFTSNQI